MAIKLSNQITFTEHKKIIEIKEYYLATSNNSNVTIETDGWTTDIQTINYTNKYLWNYEEVVYSIGNPDISEPVIIGFYGQGEAGKGISNIINYYQITQNLVAPELPTSNDQKGWSSDVSTASNLTSINKYLWNYEAIIYTDGTTTMTDPAIIGVYGDSGENAITFEIYSTQGFVFKENLNSIELKIAAFDGSDAIANATYTWEWWNTLLNDGSGGYEIIETDINSQSFVVDKTKKYAFATLKCSMNYNDNTYEDYVTLADETIIYSSVVKFFNGNNIFQSTDKYLVAFIDLYKNNDLIETISSTKFYTGISTVETSYGNWEDASVTGYNTNSIEVLTNNRDGYLWRCKITDANGNEIYSDPATLEVVEDDYFIITSHPSSVTVDKSGNATFSVVATGEDLSYQWQYRTSANGEWRKAAITGNTTSSIAVNATYENTETGSVYNRNGYQWRCEVTDMHGIKIYSSPATLTVVDSIDFAIVSHPASVTTTSKKYERFTVEVEGNGLEYQWQYKAASKVITGVSTDNCLDGDQMYFIYINGDGLYNAVLGQYVSGSWIPIEEKLQYIYTNTLRQDIKSNIVVISKEDVNKSIGIDFTIYNKDKEISKSYAMVIDGNDPIVSSDAPENPVNNQLWLDTSVNPSSLKIYVEETNQWVECAEHAGNVIYTASPSTYSKGDLWILANGEEYQNGDSTYGAGTMLKCVEDSDGNLVWIDADENLTNLKSNINQYFTFDPESGLKIGQTDEKFYVNISSTRMSFCENPNIDASESSESIDPNEVVYISNKSAGITNMIVEDNAEFNCNVTMNASEENNYEFNLFGFIWKKESNGSLSLFI